MNHLLMGDKFTVDVSRASAALRKHEWSQALRQYYFSLDVKTAQSFSHGRMMRHEAGKARIIMLTSDPMQTHRSARDAQLDGDDSFVIELPRVSSLRLLQGRCDHVVAPGSFAMITAADGYIYEQPEANELYSIKLPYKMICSRFPMAYEYLNRPMSLDCPMALLFADFAASACLNLPSADPEATETTIRHLIEMLALALTRGREHVSSSTVQANLRRQATGLIERNFRNPDLRIADIAQAMRVSERYLQKVFADANQSLGGLLRDRRIVEAKRLLQRLEAMPMTMTQIAMDAGFSDSSYFCRVFRKETGMSPTEYVRFRPD